MHKTFLHCYSRSVLRVRNTAMTDRVQHGSEMAAFGSPIIPPPEPIPELDPEPDPSPNPHPWMPTGETYIVQVPKEQIYRVPPPENAVLVEWYRNQIETRTNRTPVLKYLAWFFGVVLLLGVLCGITAIVFVATVRPASPRFTVDRVRVKKSGRPEYDFTVQTQNPSGAMMFMFEKAGKAILLNNGVNVATGKTTELDLDSKNTANMKIILKGLKMVVPNKLNKALKGGKDLILFKLELQIKVSWKAWGIERNGMNMSVTCYVGVTNLAEEAGIKSQKCKTNLKWM